MMKRLVLCVLSALLMLSFSACYDKKPFGEKWDGNYLYFSGGYKTKTNSDERIYFADEFEYKGKTVKTETYNSIHYALNNIHMIVSDKEGTYYYLLYNPRSGEVAGVFAAQNRFSLYYGEDYVRILSDGQYIYINSEGMFPPVSANSNSTYAGNCLILSHGGLKYAFAGSIRFITVTDQFCIFNGIREGRLYYICQGYNIYDLQTGENRTFPLEEDSVYNFFGNGTYMAYYNYYEENSLGESQLVRNGFRIIAYNENYEKMSVILPENLDFSENQNEIKNGCVNLTGREYKENGIVKNRLFHIDENFCLQKGRAEDVPRAEEEYSSMKCGIFQYSTKRERVNRENIFTLYGKNTQSGEEYFCRQYKQYNIFVILPY